jgi:hypothetical protein
MVKCFLIGWAVMVIIIIAFMRGAGGAESGENEQVIIAKPAPKSRRRIDYV